MDDTAMIEQIGAEIAQSDAVIVIGSDFSCYSGLPTFAESLSELATFTNESVTVAPADYPAIVSKLSTEQLAQFMRRICRVGAAQPHEVFRSLVELQASCFVSTTHDCLLEASLRIWRTGETFRVVSNSNKLETAELTSPWANHFVFKPLGDVSDVNGIVLTQRQFEEATRRHAFDTMKLLVATRPTVFIGIRQDEPAFA